MLGIATRLLSRRHLVGCFVFACVWITLALHEVLPQYHVEHERSRGRGWRDHPSFLVGDCPYYRATLLSVMRDGDLDIKNNFQVRQYQASSNVALGTRGEWYPKHPVLMPIAAIPFYAVARDLGLIFFNLAQLSALVTLIWYGAQRYTSTSVATALAFACAFGTMLRSASYNFAPDVFSTLLVTAGVVASLYEGALLSGVCLGLAVWAKWTNCVFLPLPIVFFSVRFDARSAILYSLGAGVPVLMLLYLNYHMFGSAFITPYDRVLVRVNGRGPLVLEPSHRTFFTQPFWDGLWDQLTDREMGLFVACPVAVLVPLGALLLLRSAPSEAVLLVGACAVQLAIFAKYDQWRESSYGPRFLLTVVALSGILAAPVVQRVFAGTGVGRPSK